MYKYTNLMKSVHFFSHCILYADNTHLQVLVKAEFDPHRLDTMSERKFLFEILVSGTPLGRPPLLLINN